MVWARADRPSRMILEWATTEGFADARRVVGPAALAESDYAAKLDLIGLPAGQQIFYRVLFEDLASPTRPVGAGDRQIPPPPPPAAATSASSGRAIPPPGLGH